MIKKPAMRKTSPGGVIFHLNTGETPGSKYLKLKPHCVPHPYVFCILLFRVLMIASALDATFSFR
jgi:hypothetical protein